MARFRTPEQIERDKATQRRCYIRRRDARLHERDVPLHRTCRICKETKEITKFRVQAMGPNGYSSACKVCLNAPEAAYRRRKRAQRWAYELYHHAKPRAKAKGLECTITEESILAQFAKQGGLCFWLQIELHLYGPPYHPLRPTLDRLDPKGGYTVENVVVASRFANTGRGVCSQEETMQIMQHIRKQQVLPDPGLLDEGGDR